MLVANYSPVPAAVAPMEGGREQQGPELSWYDGVGFVLLL